jgi:hypothetical protein
MIKGRITSAKMKYGMIEFKNGGLKDVRLAFSSGKEIMEYSYEDDDAELYSEEDPINAHFNQSDKDEKLILCYYRFVSDATDDALLLDKIIWEWHKLNQVDFNLWICMEGVESWNNAVTYYYRGDKQKPRSRKEMLICK